MTDNEYIKTNREKRQKARHGMHWCDTCDADFVGAGSKCKVCGQRNGRKRFKKE